MDDIEEVAKKSLAAKSQWFDDNSPYIEEDTEGGTNLGESALSIGECHLALQKEGWEDWFAKGARYKIQGLDNIEAEEGWTKPVEYEHALHAAIVSGYDDVREEVVTAILEMPERLRDDHVSGEEVALRYVPCLAEVAEDEIVTAESQFPELEPMIEQMAPSGKLKFITDMTDRFEATITWFQSLFAGDTKGVETSVQQILEWHADEVYDQGVANYLCFEGAALWVLSREQGFKIEVNSPHLDSQIVAHFEN